MTAKRGPKVKFSRTRDAAALFLALRGAVGYRRAIADVSALLGVPARNIERELLPETTMLPTAPGVEAETLALCAIVANKDLIRAKLQDRVVDGVSGWPEPFRSAVEQLIPGT